VDILATSGPHANGAGRTRIFIGQCSNCVLESLKGPDLN